VNDLSTTPAGLLEPLCASITAPDDAVREAAVRAFDAKTKPRRSLGRVETLAADVAAIRGTTALGELVAGIVVAAGDHGVAVEGVSAYPAEVTEQMVANIAGGGAAISVLARTTGARLVLVDAGTAAERVHPGALDVRVARGTGNIAVEPAMTHAQATTLLLGGAELARGLVREGVNLIALGEMGIANSTVAAALTAALAPADPGLVCGHGTGVDDRGREHKVVIVRRALAASQADATAPLATLAALGGFEIAFLTGVTLGAAAARVPVLLDGFITGAAALAAIRIEPAAGGFLIASHRSREPGHRVILDALGLAPLVDLDLRLGEGSGAALCIPLVAAALALYADMATFAAAGVTDAGA
jgi:nicotinate-nucleotide--dimethylbenzimidazole phosphoribosyltransferase